MYYRKEMVKILKSYLIPKKSYGTLSKGAIFLANPVDNIYIARSSKLYPTLEIRNRDVWYFNLKYKPVLNIV